jgi:hypothetical protein
MKNTLLKHLHQNQLIVLLLLLGLFILSFGGHARPGRLNPDKQRFSLDMSATASCNGYGFQYNPYATIKLGNHVELGGGPLLHKKTFDITGFQGRALFYLLNAEDSYSGKTSLYHILFFENHTNQSFCKNWIGIEEWIARNSIYNEFNFNNIRFKGQQFSAGFGVSHNFTQRISLNFNLAFSWYKVGRVNYQQIPLYYESQGFGLHLSTGLAIHI